MVLALASAPPVPAAAKPVPPVVTAAVQISQDPNPARAHAMAQITRNPKTGTLIVADSDARIRRTVDVYRSTNVGASWQPAGDPMLKPWTDSSGDPDANVNHTLAYDKNGVLYIAFQANDPKFSQLARKDRPRHIFLARSTDDGLTFSTVKVWDAPEAPEADRGLKRNNRPWVAVDPTNPKYVYVSWMQWHIDDQPTASGNKALIAASSDGGRTFGKPFSLREGDPQGSYEARPAVDGKGVVHVVMAGRGRVPPATDPTAPPAAAPIRTVNYRFSTDHGHTWSPAKEIEQGNAGFAFNRKWGLRADPNSNTLYAVWYGTPDPRATRPTADREIYLRISYDSGKNWTDRILVNDDAALPSVQHYDPNISVAPNGRLDVTWFDGRNSPTPEIDKPTGNDGGYQDVYYRYSNDRGRTFSQAIKVTDRIIDRRYGVWSNNSHIHAPVGIVSTNDTVYFAWQDSRNGTNDGSAEDSYFASVRLNEKKSSGVPHPLLVAASLAGGMGITMLLVLGLSRRGGSTKRNPLPQD
jgi:hypothetical protein